MQAYVYKSSRKQDTYVYLASRDGFVRIPEAVRLTLGDLQFVLEVELTPERKLARANPAVVRENLALRGFHLQIPPSGDHDPMSGDHGTDA
ncbi:MAG: YcgL domain-containing protein [Lysobacter sp.]|nr:YcgL domain-containing protein [Lysobacter sp.]MDQ3269934.1 YcgL domain-containing protein [Pseudomonadota bacterium]